MERPRYYLDGYNLIFSKELDPDPLKEYRDLLIERLSTIEERRLILVFDAANNLEPLTRSHKNHLEIVYTGPGQTADDYILDILRSREKPKRATVVSSDMRLLRLCKDLGAKALSPQAFFSYIEKKRKGNSPSLADVDVERYLRIFKNR